MPTASVTKGLEGRERPCPGGPECSQQLRSQTSTLSADAAAWAGSCPLSQVTVAVGNPSGQCAAPLPDLSAALVEVGKGAPKTVRGGHAG